jgi:hypothetical protein
MVILYSHIIVVSGGDFSIPEPVRVSSLNTLFVIKQTTEIMIFLIYYPENKGVVGLWVSTILLHLVLQACFIANIDINA